MSATEETHKVLILAAFEVRAHDVVNADSLFVMMTEWRDASGWLLKSRVVELVGVDGKQFHNSHQGRPLMEPKTIVLILMLALPNGEASVSVHPMTTEKGCIERANLEVSDPFVSSAECAVLDDGVLQLQFGQAAELADQEPHKDAALSLLPGA
ncbi:MAG: hypothetical protein AAFV69_02910 [Pseudomonadota bacterium]